MASGIRKGRSFTAIYLQSIDCRGGADCKLRHQCTAFSQTIYDRGIAVPWLFTHHLLEFGAGISQFMVPVLSLSLLDVRRPVKDRASVKVLVRPFHTVGLVLPMVAVDPTVSRLSLSFSDWRKISTEKKRCRKHGTVSTAKTPTPPNWPENSKSVNVRTSLVKSWKGSR